MRNVHTHQPFGTAFVIKTFHFSVQTVSHLLQHDVSIGIFPGMLTVCRNICKNFINIRQVEIPAQSQILGPPIITTEKRVHIRDTTFASSRVTQMSHIQFSGKRQALFGIFSIMKLLLCQILETTVNRTEYFCNGTRTEATFTEHVFLTRIGL